MSLAFESTGIGSAGASFGPTPAIAETIARVAARVDGLGVRFGPLPVGWPRASELISEPEAMRELLARVMTLYTIDDRQVGASFLVLGYAWYLMAPAVACYLIEQRVPDLAPETVALHLTDGAAFDSARCWVLPGDPAAGQNDVVVVADLAELRQKLVEQLWEQHAPALFATLRSVAPYGIPAMRANYIDRLASVVIWLAEVLEHDELARREVPAMVALMSPTARTGIDEIEHAGRPYIFLHRAGCCLNYRLPGEEKCSTCRLRSADERAAIIRADLSAEAQTA